MIAVDLSSDVIIPSGVAIVGALVAGISAVLRSWFENKDARSRGDRKLDLAMKRTEFAKEWIAISQQLDDEDSDDEVPNPEDPNRESKAALIKRARKELQQAAQETEIAFYDATTDTSTGLGQLRRLLMLTRRRNLASYVVSGLFLFVSVFVWLIVCIPTPGDDGFSIPAAIFVSIVATFVLRVLAGLAVRVLERHAISDSERIADVAVRDNVVTITTKAEHRFKAGEPVLIDASDDRFDGTFKEIGIPQADGPEDAADRTKFTFELRAANAESLPGVTGWVCGDSTKEQMQRLFMVQHRKRGAARVASGLFLLSVVAISAVVIWQANRRYDSGQYPLCIGDPYDGTYYGIDDYLDGDPDAARLLIEFSPRWSTNWLTFVIDDSVKNSKNTYFDSDYLQPDKFSPKPTDPEFGKLLEDTNGEKYFLDFWGLRYADKSTVLYRRIGDRLRKSSEPCAPQSLKVTITPAPILDFDDNGELFPGEYVLITEDPEEWDFIFREWKDTERDLYERSLFRYYDDSSSTGLSWISLFEVDSPEKSEQIKAYFGRDGRLIPVCDDIKYPEIYPCLEPSDAYYDSGFDAAVELAFRAGLVILLGSIVSRLIFGWIANRFDSTESKNREPEDSEQAAPADVTV